MGIVVIVPSPTHTHMMTPNLNPPQIMLSTPIKSDGIFGRPSLAATRAATSGSSTPGGSIGAEGDLQEVWLHG